LTSCVLDNDYRSSVTAEPRSCPVLCRFISWYIATFDLRLILSLFVQCEVRHADGSASSK